jgi:hypothetical protein
MSERKLNQLFQAARKVAPPPLSTTLADDVVRAIKQSPSGKVSGPTLFEELNTRFAVLATVTVLILILGVAANLAMGTQEITDWSGGVAQLSAQWFLLPEGL